MKKETKKGSYTKDQLEDQPWSESMQQVQVVNKSKKKIIKKIAKKLK